MNVTEQLLNELQLVKQNTFNSQASLADMTAKLDSDLRNRQMTETKLESDLRQRQIAETDKTKDALVQMYADKLKVVSVCDDFHKIKTIDIVIVLKRPCSRFEVEHMSYN